MTLLPHAVWTRPRPPGTQLCIRYLGGSIGRCGDTERLALAGAERGEDSPRSRLSRFWMVAWEACWAHEPRHGLWGDQGPGRARGQQMVSVHGAVFMLIADIFTVLCYSIHLCERSVL